MAPALRLAALALSCSLAVSQLAADGGFAPPTPEQLAAQERIRPLVTAIWQEFRTPANADEARPRLFWDVSDKLFALGPDVVPFLDSELDLADPETFNISAYVLGRLGGSEAEAALRKAVRGADARGGRFGLACKKYALLGLALMGRPDALELAQTGQLSLHGVEIVPDLPLHVQLALLIGHDAAPILSKQLDTYLADPKATDQLEDTLFAVGRAGDPSVVPKLLPLLSHASAHIRVGAAEAISRLGEPSLCDALMPLLASKNLQEKLIVAAALDRWKPAPCYKAIVGQLEIEPDVPVRSYLYSAMSAMGGESALPGLRVFLQSSNQFDQAVVVDSIGRIGSKKGLNILRVLLPNANSNTAVHALQAIASIGGDGAVDTLLAAASDRRPNVASAAKDILTRLGDKRIAPRRAEDLLAIVREPVGNISLRYRVVALTDAVVALNYAEALDDVKTALAVQTDPEIVDTLTSGVRRMEILKKDGDDAAAWAGALASTFKDVRLLAGRRLVEIGSPAAVRSLSSHLSRTDVAPDERAAILVAIGNQKTAGGADLVERHLTDPAFDAWAVRDARAAAAYAARRLGGERMARALRASASRRDGRDWATVVYLAVLEKDAAAKTLASLRHNRMRYPEARVGHEDALLEGILADLAAGRSLSRFDVPPDTLSDL